MTITQPVRLLAIDIDGTLLDPHKKLTHRTRQAVQMAQQTGAIVTLATARRYGNSRPFAEELDLDIPLITYDGALIIKHPQKEILHTEPLAADIAQQAVNRIIDHRLQPIVHHHFLESGEETWAAPAEFDTPEVGIYLEHYPNVRRIHQNELCAGAPSPLRIAVFADVEAIERLTSDIAALDCAWYAIKSGNYGCGELVIMNKRCNKASGVIALAQSLNIPLQQVMAIGDNINDMTMLQMAGLGIAMGHAPAEVRAIADAVTASNREDGVALAIERYILAQTHPVQV